MDPGRALEEDEGTRVVGRATVRFTGVDTITCRTMIGHAIGNNDWWFRHYDLGGGKLMTAYVPRRFLNQFQVVYSMNKQVMLCPMKGTVVLCIQIACRGSVYLLGFYIRLLKTWYHRYCYRPA